MALPVNVTDLIYQRIVESTRIEYKEDWNPEPILHSIVAFANDFDNLGGGYLLIGIEEENGIPVLPISGQAKQQETEDLPEKMRAETNSIAEISFWESIMPFGIHQRKDINGKLYLE